MDGDLLDIKRLRQVSLHDSDILQAAEASK